MNKKRIKKNNKKKIVICASALFIILIIVSVLIFGRAIYDSIEKNIYPLKYTEEVNKACDEFNISEILVYSVIKAESNFRAEAVSSAGATGLMQLMPETYSWLAKKLGDGGDPDKITDPETNIRYGVYYLSILIKKYNVVDTALCAYNAGPGRVDSWLSDARYSDDGKTLTEIPFNETKKYVAKINDYINKYTSLYNLK